MESREVNCKTKELVRDNHISVLLSKHQIMNLGGVPTPEGSGKQQGSSWTHGTHAVGLYPEHNTGFDVLCAVSRATNSTLHEHDRRHACAFCATKHRQKLGTIFTHVRHQRDQRNRNILTAWCYNYGLMR